jgi:hypothetical protein
MRHEPGLICDRCGNATAMKERGLCPQCALELHGPPAALEDELARDITPDMPAAAAELARRIMALTDESGVGPTVVGAALARAMAGFWAQLTLDAGDTPECAVVACYQQGHLMAEMASSLAVGHQAGREIERRRLETAAGTVQAPTRMMLDDVLIETMCRAYWETRCLRSTTWPWAEVSPEVAEDVRKGMRAALKAAGYGKAWKAEES